MPVNKPENRNDVQKKAVEQKAKPKQTRSAPASANSAVSAGKKAKSVKRK